MSRTSKEAEAESKPRVSRYAAHAAWRLAQDADATWRLAQDPHAAYAAQWRLKQDTDAAYAKWQQQIGYSHIAADVAARADEINASNPYLLQHRQRKAAAAAPTAKSSTPKYSAEDAQQYMAEMDRTVVRTRYMPAGKMLPREFVPYYFCSGQQDVIEVYKRLHAWKAVKPPGYYLVVYYYEAYAPSMLMELCVGKRGMTLTRV